jgi:hypothetical protein
MIQSGFFYIFIEIYRNLSFFFEKLAEFIVFFEKKKIDKWTPSSRPLVWEEIENGVRTDSTKGLSQIIISWLIKS